MKQKRKTQERKGCPKALGYCQSPRDKGFWGACSESSTDSCPNFLTVRDPCRQSGSVLFNLPNAVTLINSSSSHSDS